MIRIAMIAALLAGLSTLAQAQGGASGGARTMGSQVDPLVRVTQLDESGHPVGPAQETRCPLNGCQLAAVLRMGPATTPFQAVVSFAGQGVYVVLEAPNTGVQVRLYGDPRPTPLFLPRSDGNLNRVVHIAVDQSNARRPLQARTTGTQDTWLRIEVDQGPDLSKPVGG